VACLTKGNDRIRNTAGNNLTCSQPYPGYGCAIPRTTIGFMDTLATRYCRVAWLPNNHSRMVTWIRSPLKYCCVHVGCIATNSGKVNVSIGTARCCKGKAIHNSQSVSLWKRKKSVSLRIQSESVCASA
jgi:hypothetical protein